jgi:hypothetical protein
VASRHYCNRGRVRQRRRTGTRVRLPMADQGGSRKPTGRRRSVGRSPRAGSSSWTFGVKVETNALYHQIREAAGDIKPKNISIDTLSRGFAGSELDRAQVYACLERQPSSRTGENPPYGMIGRIEETLASFEAHHAPRSYPTPISGPGQFGIHFALGFSACFVATSSSS